jgi:hypothetical protein
MYGGLRFRKGEESGRDSGPSICPLVVSPLKFVANILLLLNNHHIVCDIPQVVTHAFYLVVKSFTL